MKENERKLSGYFTVEAAMVMPLVFFVYVFVISMLLYIYEICIWEQNGCRMLVWKVYLDGYAQMQEATENEVVSEEEICRYIVNKSEEEERSKYILGTDVGSDYSIRGGYRKIVRSIQYPGYTDMTKTFSVSTIELCPEDYIRGIKLLEKEIAEGEIEEDDHQ